MELQSVSSVVQIKHCLEYVYISIICFVIFFLTTCESVGLWYDSGQW